ncbi:hypothetical protein C3B51_18000 [Pseudoalteromonas rubra]|uniref:DUF5610 domain-containing protein n=1 Tax=Pseudoalteromonas rubra TaxID=43658 RepID=A0A4Q7E224_9GAMM|nr:hypothetical protein [Pseudoalteromonas rubra]RZM76459.1 hypothetical protein C3B51_18000 [Pseudoalteromonas rubra]
MMKVNASVTPALSGNIRSQERPPMEKLRSVQIEPQDPDIQYAQEMTISKHTVELSPEAYAKLTKQLSEDFAGHVKDFEQAQSALVTSLDLFEQFKAQQQTISPHLNLDRVDLAQKEDGTLKLVGGDLSGAQRSELEEALNGNDELKESFSKVHEGILSVLQLHSSDFDSLTVEDLRGTLKLNELTEKYSRQFDPAGLGQNMPTIEDKISADPMLFFGMMVEAINPRVSIKV